MIEMAECRRCNEPTEWDRQLGDEPLCSECWDGKQSPKSASKETIDAARTLATSGVVKPTDFAAVLGNVMADVLAGRITPSQANAACAAASQVLKMAEFQLRLKRDELRGRLKEG